jgi:hypothetical protein
MGRLWVDDEATMIGIAELMDGSRTEQLTQAEITSTISFICPWNRRFVAYKYIYDHNPPMTGEVVDLRKAENTPLYIPYVDHHTNELKYDSRRNIYDYYHKPVATNVSISVYNESGAGDGAAMNPYSARYDQHFLADAITGQDVPSIYPDPTVNSYIQYSRAKLVATYKAFARPSLYTISVAQTPQIEHRQLPSMGYRWKSDGSPIEEDQAPVCEERTELFDLTFSNCTVVPNWLWFYNNRVNEKEYKLALGHGKTRTFPAKTLLFTVKSVVTKVTNTRAEQSGLWDITLSYLYDELGYNRFRRLSSLISGPANAYKDVIINPLNEEVKIFHEVDWNDTPPMDFDDFFFDRDSSMMI